jgi:hypothetical protein
MNTVDNHSKATVMPIEFAGGFDKDDPNKLKSVTVKIYCNTARLLNKQNSTGTVCPRLFIVLTHNRNNYFECLLLIADLVVRKSPKKFKSAFFVPYRV